MKRFVTGLGVIVTHPLDVKVEFIDDHKKIVIEEIIRKTGLPSELPQEDKNYQIVIYCESLEKAQIIFSHLLDITEVLDGNVIFTLDLKEMLAEDGLPNSSWTTMDSLAALNIYKHFQQSEDILYAYALLRQSLSLHSNYWHDLDPQYFPYEQRSNLFRDHVRYGSAIVLAYQAMEQLSVAPPHKTTMTENGQWIALEKEKMLKMLGDRKINGEEKILWILRDEPTDLEAKYLVRVSSPAPWVDEKIRDCYISLLDGIMFARYLRNKIFSHSIHGLAKNCSVHEVFNVQTLAKGILNSITNTNEIQSQ